MVTIMNVLFRPRPEGTTKHCIQFCPVVTHSIAAKKKGLHDCKTFLKFLKSKIIPVLSVMGGASGRKIRSIYRGPLTQDVNPVIIYIYIVSNKQPLVIGLKRRIAVSLTLKVK